jgi:hypothetical protein
MSDFTTLQADKALVADLNTLCNDSGLVRRHVVDRILREFLATRGSRHQILTWWLNQSVPISIKADSDMLPPPGSPKPML